MGFIEVRPIALSERGSVEWERYPDDAVMLLNSGAIAHLYRVSGHNGCEIALIDGGARLLVRESYAELRKLLL